MQNQGILATLFTTSRTVFYTYFTGIFMLNGKQLLNKTDKQNFPQKCLFTLRMTRVFINVWMNMMVLLPKFSWSRYKVGMNWKTVNSSRIFCIKFRSDFAYIFTPGSLTNSSWTWAAETRFSWWFQIFRKIIICIKNAFISKDNYSSCEF